MMLAENGLRPTIHCACFCARSSASMSPRNWAAVERALASESRTLELPRKSNQTENAADNTRRPGDALRRTSATYVVAIGRAERRPRLGFGQLIRCRSRGTLRQAARRRAHSTGRDGLLIILRVQHDGRVPLHPVAMSRERFAKMRQARRWVALLLPYESGERGLRAPGRYKNSPVSGMLHGCSVRSCEARIDCPGRRLHRRISDRRWPGTVDRGDRAEGDALELVFLPVDFRQRAAVSRPSDGELPVLFGGGQAAIGQLRIAVLQQRGRQALPPRPL